MHEEIQTSYPSFETCSSRPLRSRKGHGSAEHYKLVSHDIAIRLLNIHARIPRVEHLFVFASRTTHVLTYKVCVWHFISLRGRGAKEEVRGSARSSLSRSRILQPSYPSLSPSLDIQLQHPFFPGGTSFFDWTRRGRAARQVVCFVVPLSLSYTGSGLIRSDPVLNRVGLHDCQHNCIAF